MPIKIIVKVGEKQHNFLLHCEDNCRNIADVKQFCFTRFPQLVTGNWADLKIFWKDQDGDDICVLADDDFQTFMLVADKDNRRLYVECTEAMQVGASVCPTESAPDDSASARRPLHQEFFCDGCQQGITGHRYRCLTCYNYDLCMTCESKYRHKDHIMLRIPKPLRSGTKSQRVLEKLTRYAAKLELKQVDSDVGGMKMDTFDEKNIVEKIPDKTYRTGVARSASEKAHNLGQRVWKQHNKGGCGRSTRTREHTKRDKTTKGASDSVREPGLVMTVAVAKDKIKEKSSKPLPWVLADEFHSTICRRSHKHKSHCPFSVKEDVAPLLPSESQYGSSQPCAAGAASPSATKKVPRGAEVDVAQASNQPEATGKQREAASQGSVHTLETGSVVKDYIENTRRSDTSDTSSSTSMLTDDEEENGMEAPWLLVDAEDVEKIENDDQLLLFNALSAVTRKKLATPSAPSNIGGSKSDSEEDELAEAVRSLVSEYAEMHLEKLKKRNKIPKDGGVVLMMDDQDDRTKVIIEKLQSDLKNVKNTINAVENQQQMKDQKEDVASVPRPANEEEIMPALTTTSPLSSTDTATATRKMIFSRLPHVNHAIHTMMTMGFNNDGRLRNLLEELDGDIPRALDKLVQK